MELILNSFFNFFFLLSFVSFYVPFIHIYLLTLRARSETASILFFLYPRFILYRLRAVSCLFGVTWTLVAFLLRKNIFLICAAHFYIKKRETKNKKRSKGETKCFSDLLDVFCQIVFLKLISFSTNASNLFTSEKWKPISYSSIVILEVSLLLL